MKVLPKATVKKKMKDIFLKLITVVERIKIEIFEKLLANLHDQTEYLIHIRNLKQILNHGLVSKKVHRLIKFNQNAKTIS